MPKLEPMQQPPSRSGGRRSRVMRVSTSLAEINVVPLVDVMLVLLVIFMVAAPMMQQGFAVELPQANSGKPIGEPVTVTIPLSFRKDQRVRVGKDLVALEFVGVRVKQALAGQLEQGVILAADGSLTFDETVRVFGELVGGGVTRVAIQVQPVAGRQ